MQRKRILTRRPAQWRTRFMMAVLALVVVALTVPAVSRAATRTWIGPLNGDWFTSDNWDPADSIPQADDTVIIPSDASVLLTNETAALTAFSITNATLTFSNWTTRLRAETVEIQDGADLTLPPAFTEAQMSNRVWIVCANCYLEDGAGIQANARGYSAAYGPGHGVDALYAPGAGHGGRGGRSNEPGGSPYGDVDAPTIPGSGGGNSVHTWFQPGGSGGGAVRIEAENTARINGTISANGGAGGTPSNRGSGGGSGGSVYITCNIFGGKDTGVIRADGGNGAGTAGGYPGGGGAGGRIAVHYTLLESEVAVRFSANRGAGRHDMDINMPLYPVTAEVGSLFFTDISLLNATITAREGIADGMHGAPYFQSTNIWYAPALQEIHNATLAIPAGSTWDIPLDLIVTNSRIIVGNHSELICRSNVTMTNASDLLVFSGITNTVSGGHGVLIRVDGQLTLANDENWIYPVAHSTDGGAALFELGGLTIENGSGINADSRGYANGYGLGAGQGNTSARWGGGGGYGGRGGDAGSPGGDVYGSTNAPVDPGSGGGEGHWSTQQSAGGHGGGAVRVETRGSVTINGIISANGQDGAGSSVTVGGGGSGGSIFIVCQDFTGNSNGIMRVDGGASTGGTDSKKGGGGGGGRIAIAIGLSETDRARLFVGDPIDRLTAYTVNPDYAGDLTAKGGVSGTEGQDGQDGTLRFLSVPDPDTYNLEITGSPDPYGVPSPWDYATHIGIPENTEITNNVVSPTDEADGQRWISLGWDLYDDQNNLLDSGTSTQAVFTIATNLHLVWQWTNEYALTVLATPHGVVSGNGWFTNGLSALIGAQPDNGYTFSQWSGDIPTEQRFQASTSLIMDRPLTVTASFASLTGEGKNWNGGYGDWTEADQWTPEGVPGPQDSVVISAGTVVLSSSQSVGSVELAAGATLTFTNWSTRLEVDTITADGTITLPPAFPEAQMSNRVHLVCTDFTLNGGGQILGDGRGFARSQGPGAGGAAGYVGAGGGYGGRGGGNDRGATGGVSYGSPEAPMEPGSGGGYTGLGAGGGAVRINATGAVTINGLISVNGSNGSGNGGGGSGGSIYITCNTFGGSGVLRGDGGNGGSTLAGAGGGGRIAVAYNTLAGTSAPQVSVNVGGNSKQTIDWAYPFPSFEQAGDVGTLYFSTPDLWNSMLAMRSEGSAGLYGYPVFGSTNEWIWANDLVVSNATFGIAPGNRWVVQGDLYLSGSEIGMMPSGELDIGGDLALTDYSTFRVYAGLTNALTAAYGARLDINGDLTIGSNCWVYPFSHSTNGGSVLFQMRHFSVDAGGGMNADGRGFAWEYGEGKGQVVGGIGSGAGYGGRGGNNDRGAIGGAVYGNASLPVRPGSGGGRSDGGSGGGLLWIEARGDARIDGVLTANGANGRGSYGGGGSGGGIFVSAASVAGTGVLQACGGNSGGVSSGGGAGGRIAVWHRVPASSRQAYLAGYGGGVLQLPEGEFPTFEGAVTADPGTGWRNLPDYPDEAAYPGTRYFYMVRGSLFMFR